MKKVFNIIKPVDKYIPRVKKGHNPKKVIKLDKKFFIRMRFWFIHRFANLLLGNCYIKNFYSKYVFCLLYFQKHFLIKWFIVSNYFFRHVFLGYKKENGTKRRAGLNKLKKKYIKRYYRSSNFFFDKIIDILKALAHNDDKIDKRHRRFTFSSIIKKMSIDQYKNRHLSYKDMPSVILKRTFQNSSKQKLSAFNNIIRDIDTILFLVSHVNSVISDNRDVRFDKIFFIIKFYEILYYLLILKSFGLNHYKIDSLFTIARKIFFLKLDRLNYQFIFIFFRLLSIIKFHIIKYFSLYLHSFLPFKRSRFVMFNFILKFIDFFTDKSFKVNSFYHYFFFLIKSILSNYHYVNNLNNVYINRLFVLLDNYWYCGYKVYKSRESKYFSAFFDKFTFIFSLIMVIFKLLFTSLKYNDDYFPVIYKLLMQFIPNRFVFDWYAYEDEFLPYLLNNRFHINRVQKFFLYSQNESFNHFEMLIDSLNFAGKESFSVIINSRYNLRPFPVNISNYFDYINSLVDSFGQTLTLKTEYISDKLLPYGDKIIRNKARDHIKSFLYGFKFHFVGRFTRKQQSASMWFRQGFLPSSSMKVEVDYGIFTIPLRFSACTVKVWLYRGFYSPKRLFTYGKWL